MTGLRELKKRQTRRRISDIATALFVARGFDQVTVAEVAEAAGVAKMTVFNYFSRKEDLFLDRSAEVVDDVVAAVRDREPGTTVAGALRALHRRWLVERNPMSGVVENSTVFWRVVEETPALRTRLLEQREEFVAAVAGLLRDGGAPPFEAELAAGLVSAAHSTIFTTAMRRVLAGESVDEVGRDQVAVVDSAFAAVDRALAGFEWGSAGR